MKCLVWIAAVVLASTLSLRTAPGATQGSVRERMLDAAKGSRELMAKAEALPEKDARTLAMQAVVKEDRDGDGGEDARSKSFARASEVAAYVKLRPWSAAYRESSALPAWPKTAVSAEGWSAGIEAGALRELLKDADAEVRSLAAEALGALDVPEDAPRIAALVDDQAAGPVVLGWSQQLSSVPWVSLDTNPLVPERTWHQRKVGTYAREAMKAMTGHRFDGNDPAGVTFAKWWETHNLGKQSLWYWQQRLQREELAASPEQRAALHNASVAEIKALPPDAQWKIFLLTQQPLGNVDVNGPVNPFFPDGMGVEGMLPAWRLTELTAGRNVWPEVADVEGGRQLMLARLAQAADRILLGYGNPKPYREALAKAIEREGAGGRAMPVLVSRLLPPTEVGRWDDPTYREGYLRKALAEAKEGYARDVIAAEMVRENLEAQWPVLERVFYAEKRERGRGSDARIGILKALGEAPHTAEKTQRLVELIDDPRNETLLTQVNQFMGMDMYRHYAAQSLNAIAGGNWVSHEVLQDLGRPERSVKALAELRRLAHELSKRQVE